MKAKTVEHLLHDQLAACVAATRDCLAQSRITRADDRNSPLRQIELDYVAKLMKATTRLTTAMVQLRGNAGHRLHVTRVDKGEG